MRFEHEPGFDYSDMTPGPEASVKVECKVNGRWRTVATYETYHMSELINDIASFMVAQ